MPSETDNSSLWNWLRFLKADKEEELAMLAQKSPEIYKAVGVLKELSQDERTKLLYEAREKAMRDEQARLQGAIEKTKVEFVKSLLKDNVPLDKIAQYTNLSIEDISIIADGKE